MGVERNIVEKSGAWYSYNKERIGQGKDNARQFLKENRRSPSTSRKGFAPPWWRPVMVSGAGADEALPEEAEA